MIKQLISPRFITLSIIIILAALTRALPLFIPHIWNFTAVGALAIFSGAQFRDNRLALIMPLAAMGLSDLFLGNGFSLVVYTGFLLMVICGILIRNNKSIANVVLASVSAAVVFYLFTNFAFFYPATTYPRNLAGITTSYIMAFPFLNNMIIGNLVYGSALFGLFYILKNRYPVLAD
ncbi:MAG: DUF6580 family putative transport protein [Daejeonella sp.]